MFVSPRPRSNEQLLDGSLTAILEVRDIASSLKQWFQRNVDAIKLIQNHSRYKQHFPMNEPLSIIALLTVVNTWPCHITSSSENRSVLREGFQKQTVPHIHRRLKTYNLRRVILNWRWQNITTRLFNPVDHLTSSHVKKIEMSLCLRRKLTVIRTEQEDPSYKKALGVRWSGVVFWVLEGEAGPPSFQLTVRMYRGHKAVNWVQLTGLPKMVLYETDACGWA